MEVVTHISWRRPHVGRASSVRKVLLPPRRHGRLPMGHCGQMMVHVHRLPGTTGKSPWIFQPRVASMGAMRTTLSVEDQGRGAVSVYAAILTPEVRETRAADGKVSLRAERK